MSLRATIFLLLLFSAAVLLTGITWGLPSRTADPFLFGDLPPWDGQTIYRLAGGWNDRNLGADVDVNPLTQRQKILDLNQTDAQRAEIILRYRLYSFQPDEMITFRSLSKIRQHRGDPRLYQYGGLWIYPVGALLQIASWAHLLDLRADVPFYLDYPHAFARFYIVARLYSAAWGLLGVCAVFTLARRLTGKPTLSALAAASFALLPVVINAAHEAKPHLAGAVLILLAILAADTYVHSGRRRDWILTGLLCGAAFSMVVSSLWAFILPPAMVLLRPMPWQNRLRTASLAILLAIATYFLFNPFVLVNALFNRAALFSNLGTSTAMYQVQGTAAGLRNALSLLLEGTGPLLAVAGVLSAIALASRTLFRSRQHRAPALAWLLFAPSALVLIQFFALAAGKPGEYGRFALVPDTVLLLAAFVAVDRFVRLARDRVALATILLASTAFFAFFSLRAFVRDASSTPARLQEARRLQQLYDQGARTLAITADPAPYNLPPVNLFAWHLLLLPPDPVLQTPESLPDVIIRPLDAPVPDAAAGPVYDQLPDILNRGHWHPRLPWADKPFQVLVKRGLQPPPFAQARPFTPSPTPPGY